MVTEQGTLPVGVERDGVIHKDFEVRPRLVRDSVDTMDDPRALTNESYAGLCILSRQIVRLGAIPKEEITPALLLDMYEEDLGELYRAAEEVARRLKTFRGEADRPQD